MTRTYIKSINTDRARPRSAILFDGSLPTSKRDERSARLQQMVKRVTQLRSIHSATGCPIPAQLGSVGFPLLAPSLMEEMRRSEFAQVTRIVPGEADDWCASHAKANARTIIFTNDTDLVVYDYPPEVLIMFFKDVGILPKPESKVYSPSKICQQLKLKSLVHLAYAIHIDRWKLFTENVREARQLDLESSQYLDFSRRYTDNAHFPPHLSSRPELDDPLQVLDARISEFVHQALSSRLNSTKSKPLILSSFLPLLFEDPLQASAWNLGQDLRLLSYSLLASNCVVIQEHKRKAQGIAVHELVPYTPREKETEAAKILAMMQVSSADQQLAQAQHWIFFGLQLALVDLKAPHILLMARVVTGDFDNTWAFVHLTACIQSVLYSLRMLKQCIPVWLALQPLSSSPDFYKIIASIHETLKSFPPIDELFSIPGQNTALSANHPNLLDAIKDIYVAAGIEDEKLFEEPKSKRQKKREKREKKTKTQMQQQVPQQLSSNAFDLLSQNNPD